MGVLQGLRVLDLGVLVQAPQAAATLHDLGAEVIKIELPEMGDISRSVPISMPDDLRSAFYTASNRGKRSVTLDLRTQAGSEAFLRLADSADVVISNFKPGTMDEWGLGYNVLRERNPRLIWAAGSSLDISARMPRWKAPIWPAKPVAVSLVPSAATVLRQPQLVRLLPTILPLRTLPSGS